MTKLIHVVLIALTISGCSFFRDECEGETCGGGILDNRPINQYWYCYGTPEQTWDCRHEPSASPVPPPAQQ